MKHLAPHSAIYQWHATRRQALVEQAWHECGLLVHQTIIWVKARGVLTRSHYMWSHGPCFYGWVEGNPPKLKPPASERTIWNVDQVGEQSGSHPTQKPVELFIRPIEFHTRPGDIVYEPFSGSGTQLIAAERRAASATPWSRSRDTLMLPNLAGNLSQDRRPCGGEARPPAARLPRLRTRQAPLGPLEGRAQPYVSQDPGRQYPLGAPAPPLEAYSYYYLMAGYPVWWWFEGSDQNLHQRVNDAIAQWTRADRVP